MVYDGVIFRGAGDVSMRNSEKMKEEGSTVRHKNQDRLFEAVSPIWTPERGVRLRLVRMKLMKDQHELGALLGLSQQNISAMESGRVCRARVPLSQWRAVFGVHFNYVLFGLSKEKYPQHLIVSAYWHAKDHKKGIREALKTD